MTEQMTFGLTQNEVGVLSTLAQILISVVALVLTIINLKILRRLNIVDSMRRVNDKFTELNILELENDELIAFNHNYTKGNKRLNKEQILEHKQKNMLYNHINILEGVFVEMKYKTMQKTHAMKILDTFCPTLINNEKANELLKTSGYDEEFIRFCIQYETKPTQESLENGNNAESTTA